MSELLITKVIFKQRFKLITLNLNRHSYYYLTEYYFIVPFANIPNSVDMFTRHIQKYN